MGALIWINAWGAGNDQDVQRAERFMAERSEEYCTDQCDSCRAIIVRTYRGFRSCGGDDPSAFRTAVQVLCVRHPERSQAENIERASGWIARALEDTQPGRIN